jgi:hypothetical protein
LAGQRGVAIGVEIGQGRLADVNREDVVPGIGVGGGVDGNDRVALLRDLVIGVVGVDLGRQAPLFAFVEAGDGVGAGFGLGQGRQQQPPDCDDRDDHLQFKQRESAPTGATWTTGIGYGQNSGRYDSKRTDAKPTHH